MKKEKWTWPLKSIKINFQDWLFPKNWTLWRYSSQWYQYHRLTASEEQIIMLGMSLQVNDLVVGGTEGLPIWVIWPRQRGHSKPFPDFWVLLRKCSKARVELQLWSCLFLYPPRMQSGHSLLYARNIAGQRFLEELASMTIEKNVWKRRVQLYDKVFTRKDRMIDCVCTEIISNWVLFPYMWHSGGCRL